MAESSFLWTTNGTGDGPSGGYTQAQWGKIAAILASVHQNNKVGPNYLNAFANSLSANTITVQSGGAVVDGKPYLNDANLGVNVPSAVGGGNTRIDRIVLRANWSAQTVRITRIAGTDAASPTAPAITTTSENTYDVKLYQVRVNTSGTVTIEVDEREWAQLVTNEVANDAIDDLKAGNRVLRLVKRVGGDPSRWTDGGTNVYTPTMTIRQVGSTSLTVNSGQSSASGTFNFPQAFGEQPVMQASIANDYNKSLFGQVVVKCVPLSTTQFFVEVIQALAWGGGNVTHTINWGADGPE